MLGLAQRLEKIQGIRHAMYADDITVWTTCGTLEEKRAALQDAAKCVEDYVKERASGAPPKSPNC